MNRGKFVFSQLIDFLPKEKFDWLVRKYQGNKYVKKFTCWNHLLVMIFAQLTQRESLRDLIASLSAHKSKFNRLGFGESVTRSNLSKANEQRDPRIFEDFAYILVEELEDFAQEMLMIHSSIKGTSMLLTQLPFLYVSKLFGGADSIMTKVLLNFTACMMSRLMFPLSS